jgi:hypothetical protein
VRRRATYVSAAAIIASLAALSACRTTRPAGREQPLQPLTVSSREAVIPELQRQMSSFHALRSLMRVHVTSGERSQSFRAQILVEPQTERMELTAYTPIGTEAMTIAADRDRVLFLDHVHRTAWQGSSAELARSIGFFDPQTLPAAWALDLFGFPARGEFVAGDAGLASGTVGDIGMGFDPPVFPPHRVTVTRGAETLEVTYLELASTDASVRPLSIPRDYRCCVAPEM